MRIDSTSNPTGRSARSGGDDVMAQGAPAHVDSLRWKLADANERQALMRQGPQGDGGAATSGPSAAPERGTGTSSDSPASSARGEGTAPDVSSFSVGGILFGAGQGWVQGGNRAMLEGTKLLAEGHRLLDRSREIFTKYPAQLVTKWSFDESPVNGKGGATAPLQDFLTKQGIAHNGDAPLRPAPGSVANAKAATAAGVPANQISNHNGAMAEAERRAFYKSQGFDVATQPTTVQTPAGRRDIDVKATRDVGHPTRSIEINEEVKVGRRSLPAVAAGSNERAQAVKDGSRLTEYKANAPAAHAEGHAAYNNGNKAVDVGEKLSGAGKTLKVAGKIARPLGVVVGAFEIGGAYQADGNRIGVNTMGKVAGLVGGAGGAWAGAAAGAALGSVVPGVGTVIGGIVGGIAGGLLGEGVVSGAFDKIKSWF